MFQKKHMIILESPILKIDKEKGVEHMKRILFIVFICFMVLSILNRDKSYANSTNIDYLDIKLTKTLSQKSVVNLESNTGFALYDISDKSNIIKSIEDTKIKAILNGTGDIDLVNSQDTITYTLSKDNTIIIGSNTLENPTITVEKDRYRDYIRLINKNNEIVIINHVDLENYLYGVVPREMSHTTHLEALKAQAVASRSFTISNINKHSHEGFNLCDTTHCQVYSGFEYERPSTNLAVSETKGIMAYYDGKVIEAFYHSTSSGFTEDSLNVWGGEVAYLKSVEDIFSLDSPYSNWSFSMKTSDLNDKLVLAGIDIGDLQGIEVMGTTLTGKVDKVKLIGSRREEIITGNNFRNLVGNTTLKSTWFNINNSGLSVSDKAYVISGDNKSQAIDISKAYIIDGNEEKKVNRGTVSRAMGKDRVENLGGYYPISSTEILIEGKGYGHGVGMSQYGAKKMAELGYSYDEILKYYYTGIEIIWAIE